MKENFIDDLTYFEKKNKIKIDIVSDNKLIIPEYIIDFKNKSKKTLELVEHYEKLKNLEQQKKMRILLSLRIKRNSKRNPSKEKNFSKKLNNSFSW